MLSDLYSTSLHLLRGGNLNFLQLADTGQEVTQVTQVTQVIFYVPSDVVPARLKSHKSRQEHARKLKVNVLSITYAHILLRNNDPFRSIVLVDFVIMDKISQLVIHCLTMKLRSAQKPPRPIVDHNSNRISLRNAPACSIYYTCSFN